ncbi:MAG: APC family permease, partial [Corynebacterium variabile]|uniref:APC family permease n=1 Tax=Corynebacterium variabile TaxID=1727 RepID=UPI003F91739E
LFFNSNRGPDVVFDTGSAGQGDGYIWAWIASGLMAAYVMVGFGSAGELAEETKNPRRVAPKTIRQALTLSALGGGLLIIGALMAAPSLTDGQLAEQGLPYVLNSVLSSPWGTLLLIDVAIAVLICTLAIQTAASRLMFSMARDGRLPAAEHLAKVNPRTGTPILPSVIVGVACIVVLLVNVGNDAIFATLTSVCIILIYLAYLLVTGPLLYQRLRGWPGKRGVETDAEGRPLFSLGKFGIVVNVFAVCYGALMIINLSWPRAEIYNPSGDMPWMQWAGPLAVAICIIAGLLAFPRNKEHPRPVTVGE